MALPYRHLLTALLTLSASTIAFAIGVPSNILVTSTATANHEISGIPQVQQTAIAQFLVDNKVDLSLSVTSDTVSPAQINQIITFVIINEGNTPQGYALSVANSTTADDFDMNNVRIYVESNGTPGWQAGDTLYTSGNNAGDLDPNSSIPGADTMTVYVLANVPPSGGGSAPVDAANARYDLLVTTLNAGSTTATVGQNADAWIAGTVQDVFAEGSAGPHASDGNDDGQQSTTGVYSVNAPALSVVKSAVVLDLQGGGSPSDGATITYTLLVSISGTGSTDNVVITDVIPANTTYVSNSLTLNAASLSDGADADEGDFNISNANNITVDLGNLTNASGNQTITFSVTINP